MKKNRELERHCQNLNHEANPKKFFATFGIIANPLLGEKQSGTQPRPLEDELGNKGTISQEKADLFANRLQRIHQEPDFTGFNNEWKNTVNEFIADNERLYKSQENEKYSQEENSDDLVLCKEVTLEELDSNLARGKNRSVPGQDRISYHLIKKLPKESKTDLCRIFPDAIRLGYFPKLWKTALVKMIPKPNKDTK